MDLSSSILGSYHDHCGSHSKESHFVSNCELTLPSILEFLQMRTEP